jgi:zinc transport system ATP-binding protein
MSGPENVIEVKDLVFSYGNHVVLQNVSFTIRDRELVSIIGPNGSGKTTLLRLLLGLLRPDSGHISILGSAPEEKRGRIGYVPQQRQFDLQFPMTCFDMVLMGRAGKGLFGHYSADDRRIAMGAMEQTGIADKKDLPFSSLSGGQRQRALIARALAVEPAILFLDEPTSYVDSTAGERLYRLFRELSSRFAILMVSHDIGFVSTWVDTVLCVNKQAVIHPTSKLTGEMINELYHGDVEMIRHNHICSERGHSSCRPS